MNIQLLNGKSAINFADPDYFDCKLYHDQTASYRDYCRVCIRDAKHIRRLRDAAGSEKRREALSKRSEMQDARVRQAWRNYRTTYAIALRLERAFLDTLSRHPMAWRRAKAA